ncbi:MAG: DUF1080 domain-containing protein [Myxococcales bacterium]|nr:DUF1080 domain-containing protein [Myxococcales bacterium]
MRRATSTSRCAPLLLLLLLPAACTKQSQPAPATSAGSASAKTAETSGPASKPAADHAPTKIAKATTPKASPRPMLRAQLWRFDGLDDGALPVGFRSRVGRWGAVTPAGKKAAPKIGKVVLQAAKSRSHVFNVLLAETISEADLALEVRMRARSGKIDQGGGLVWRAADDRNYYIARYNPLEDNYRLYTVTDGRRRQLASARVKLDHRAWHTLRVTMRGDHVQCFLDGKRLLEKHDSTFAEAGKIGLWSKADAVSEFDDLSVRNLQPKNKKK